MEQFAEDLDYPFLVTMDEMLAAVIEHSEAARRAAYDEMFEAHLKLASRAMRCALQIYIDWSNEKVRTQEKTDEKHV